MASTFVIIHCSTLIQIIVIIAPPPNVAYPFIIDIGGYPQQIINFFIVIVRYIYTLSVTFHTNLLQGLFWLRYKKPDVIRPFKGAVVLFSVTVSTFYVFFFNSMAATCSTFPRRCYVLYVIIANWIVRPFLTLIVVIIAPFLEPANKVGDSPPLPYYLYAIFAPFRVCAISLSLTIQRYCLVGIAIMAFSVFYWAVWRIILPKLGRYKLVPEKERLEDGTVVTIVGVIFTHSKHC